MTWPDRKETARLAIAGSLLLLAGVALRLLEWVFATRPIVAVLLGALLLDIWSRRLGARWSTSAAGAGSFKTWIFALATGLGIGFLAVAGASATGSARIVFGPSSLTGAILGSARASLYAFRDELLFRGVPLALAGAIPKPWPALFSALLGVAPGLLVPGVRVEGILLALISGVFFALQWSEGDGGRSAWAGHTGWLIAVQVATSTKMVGVPAYLATVGFAVAGWFVFAGKHRWRSARPT